LAIYNINRLYKIQPEVEKSQNFARTMHRTPLTLISPQLAALRNRIQTDNIPPLPCLK
jgi:hypothetical protein